MHWSFRLLLLTVKLSTFKIFKLFLKHARNVSSDKYYLKAIEKSIQNLFIIMIALLSDPSFVSWLTYKLVGANTRLPPPLSEEMHDLHIPESGTARIDRCTTYAQ